MSYMEVQDKRVTDIYLFSDKEVLNNTIKQNQWSCQNILLKTKNLSILSEKFKHLTYLKRSLNVCAQE